MVGCLVKLEGGKWLWSLRCKNFPGVTRSDVINVFRSLTVIVQSTLSKKKTKLCHKLEWVNAACRQNAFWWRGHNFLLVLNVCLQSLSRDTPPPPFFWSLEGYNAFAWLKSTEWCDNAFVGTREGKIIFGSSKMLLTVLVKILQDKLYVLDETKTIIIPQLHWKYCKA